MARYIMRKSTMPTGAPFSVVDAERSIAVPRTKDREYPVFKPVCECAEEGDAMMIADALNKMEMV